MPRAVRPLLVTAVVALVASGCASAQKRSASPHTPARSGASTTALAPTARASPQVLRLGRCELRFRGVSQGMGTGVEGTVSSFFYMRFVNVGHACRIDSSSRVRLTATTDSRGLLRAKLSATRFRIGHREHVAMVVGTWWGLRSKCAPGNFSSVSFHSRWGSKALSFPRNPYFVCTPVQTSFYLEQFAA